LWVSQCHHTLSGNMRYHPSRGGFGGDSATNVPEGRWVPQGTEPESDALTDGRAFEDALEGTEPESDDHADGVTDHGIPSRSAIDEYRADVCPVDESFVWANDDDPTDGGTYERTVSQSDGKAYETSNAESDAEAHENAYAEPDEEADQRPLGHSACQRGLVYRLGHREMRSRLCRRTSLQKSTKENMGKGISHR